MKKPNLLLAIASIFFFASCHQQLKNYVTISGTIYNSDSQDISIYKNTQTELFFGNKDSINLIKKITFNEFNNFTDTLSIAKGLYAMNIGHTESWIYLENGHSVKLKLDENKEEGLITAKGEDKNINNHLFKKTEEHIAIITKEEIFREDTTNFLLLVDSLLESNIQEIKTLEVDSATLEIHRKYNEDVRNIYQILNSSYAFLEDFD